MSDIFISHTSADNERAQRVKEYLEKAKFPSIFLDFDPEKGIPTGQSWERTLYRRLRASQAVVALVSKRYLASRWCFAEVAMARMIGRRIFTVRLEDLKSNELPSILTEAQNIKVLPDWGQGMLDLVSGLELAAVERGIDRRKWVEDHPGQSPFLGLTSFQEEHEGIYFGRGPQIEECLGSLRRLQARGMQLVLGASGSGKSSLVRAGVVPKLKRDPGWLVIAPFAPGADPVKLLAYELAAAFDQDYKATRGKLEEVGLAELVRDYLLESGNRRRQVLFAVDQFEELLGPGAPAGADGFLSMLRTGLKATDPPFRVLATLRSDFLPAFQRHPSLLDIEFDHISLGPMSEAALAQVIMRPADLVDVKLEEPEGEASLVQRMVKAAGREDGLPLLAYTLSEMWHVEPDNRDWTIQRYNNLGGLEGAVVKRAEEIFKKLAKTPELEASLQLAFVRMARITDEGTFARRRLRVDELDRLGDGVRTMLETFKDARLLVFRSDAGEATVEVAHEALLKSWPTLRGWLEETRIAIEIERRLERDVRAWNENGRAPEYLWRGRRLQRAMKLEAERPQPPEVSAFLAASRAEDAAQHGLQAQLRQRLQESFRDSNKGLVALAELGRSFELSAEDAERWFPHWTYLLEHGQPGLEDPERRSVLPDAVRALLPFLSRDEQRLDEIGATLWALDRLSDRDEAEDGELEELRSAVASCLPQSPARVEQEWSEIPPGTFLMGSPEEQREVTLEHGFLMLRHPVTNAGFRRLDPLHSEAEPDDHPAVRVKFWKAYAYAEWVGGRLPREREWEYACRAGTTTRYWSGDTPDDLARVGWFHDNSERRIHPVGTKPANDWGLFDMHGDVRELCERERRDWTRYLTSQYIQRGGAFRDPAEQATAAFRIGGTVGPADNLGFRVVIPLDSR